MSLLIAAVLALFFAPRTRAYCYNLPAPTGATLSNYGPGYNGMTVTATCYNGSYMIGPNTLTCTFGNWQPPSFGRCSQNQIGAQPFYNNNQYQGQNGFPIGTGTGQNGFPIGTGTAQNGFPIGTGSGGVGPVINSNGPIGSGVGNIPYQPLYQGGFAAKNP
ncbi:sushi domain protein [Ancylostoma caninum]|uniref:Sushi domain protein n=1 Tax=Ancylostoma caninum TaxID=29170 RepID=A0A368G2T7_ANCCA|nr:sushi domain protein [Ancylostoma caninum]